MQYFRTQTVVGMLAVLVVMAGACGTACAGDYVLIVNKGNTTSIDKDLAAKIYSADVRAWKDGGTINAIDLPEDNPVRASFTKEVLGKTVGNVKALWAQLVFSGRALPPKQVASDDEVKKLVAADKNAIGYIKAGSQDDSVKVALK